MNARESVTETGTACERYWRASGIGRAAAAEMRQELEGHLAEAIADGRSIADVVGNDTAVFAAEWASEQLRRSPADLPSWRAVMGRSRRIGTADWLAMAAVTATITAGFIWGRGGDNHMDNEIWRWVWVGAAALFGIGEMFTAGFFMLPFAIGALAAVPLAWLGVNEFVQLTVFLGVSVAALLMIQRFVRKSDEHQPAVGANRYMHSTGIVVEAVDRTAGVGRVRVETENWRATTDGDPIPEGTEVRVVSVRGTRLVVEPN
jgi:membrane protein implicated in regulation of membrane protease activity